MSSGVEKKRLSSGWLDANVILRFLLNDHPDHSLRAKTLIEKAERGETTLRITQHIISEVVYVLESQGYERKEVSDALMQFISISGIEMENADEVMTALIWYRDKNVDFSDALLYAVSSSRGERVWTFNKHHFCRLGSGWDEP